MNMLIGLKEILSMAEERKAAIPAFNIYNAETVMGVARAAEKMGYPVIFQIYSRLFDKENGRFAAASVLEAAKRLSVPCALHLDHGSGVPEVMRAIRAGATSIMIDASTLPLDENIARTKEVHDLCQHIGIEIEGELGHVGTVNDDGEAVFTDPEEAKVFAERTGVAALAVQIGNAHGRYRKKPNLDIPRIKAIRESTGLPLVLHGGTGIPDDQIRAAIENGIRKVNFGTDVCYAFLDAVRKVPESLYALDLAMEGSIEAVEAYAESKIRLLGGL